MLLGIPVAFAQSGAALIVSAVALLFGLFDFWFLAAKPSRIHGTAAYNEVLTAALLCILMG